MENQRLAGKENGTRSCRKEGTEVGCIRVPRARVPGKFLTQLTLICCVPVQRLLRRLVTWERIISWYGGPKSITPPEFPAVSQRSPAAICSADIIPPAEPSRLGFRQAAHRTVGQSDQRRLLRDFLEDNPLDASAQYRVIYTVNIERLWAFDV